MSRGKYARRAENGRIGNLQAMLAAAESEIRALRAKAAEDVKSLTEENDRLRRDILVEASKLAEPEITKNRALVWQEAADKGITIEAVEIFRNGMDRFAYNACRYVSMVTGDPPAVAIDSVMTWLTDEDYRHIVDPADWLFRRGFPSDGFIAHFMTDPFNRFQRKRYARHTTANSLDYVEAHRSDFPNVHPNYRPEWYRELR